MSLFGHGNDLNRQFIARPDEAKQDILFKWPDLTIRKFTQVTVQPDETALFIKEGKVAGTLPQGRSTLDGALIPFLGDIVDWASGGNMYRAELYFVGTREFVSLPFGGPVDNIEDPETGLAVGLRVYGEYALVVSDPAAMILKLVGTRQASNDLITDWAREQILKMLRTSVVRKLTTEKWPVLGIAARTGDIEAALIAVQKARTLKDAKKILLNAIAGSRKHFDKEERIVFPLAERILKTKTLSDLGEQWLSRRQVSKKW